MPCPRDTYRSGLFAALRAQGAVLDVFVHSDRPLEVDADILRHQRIGAAPNNGGSAISPAFSLGENLGHAKGEASSGLSPPQARNRNPMSSRT